MLNVIYAFNRIDAKQALWDSIMELFGLKGKYSDCVCYTHAQGRE